MGDRQKHRGMHPEDNVLFSPPWIEKLRCAVKDLSYLMTRGYSRDAALKTVGDHYQLHARQRRALLRCASSDQSLEYRLSTFIDPGAIADWSLIIDGYNLLITVESMLAGGVLLRGRDRCVRDMASVHGSYRRVEETIPAIRAIGCCLQQLRPGPVLWLFDAPVSNSGRLKNMMEREAAASGWNWTIELSDQTDQRIAASDAVIITADGWILDRCHSWTRICDNLLGITGSSDRVIDLAIPEAG